MDGNFGGAANGNSNGKRKKKRKNQRAVNGMLADVGAYTPNSGGGGAASAAANGNGGGNKWKNAIMIKARSLMNLHNNEAGRRVSF